MFGPMLRQLGLLPHSPPTPVTVKEEPFMQAPPKVMEIGEIRGQQDAKSRLLVAAVGMHNLILVGPPGEGKTTLAMCLASILGPMDHMSYDELLDNYEDLPGEPKPLGSHRPFIETGPACTETALIGGGRKQPIPGYIARAHGGILFIDEFPQYDKKVIDSLREPLERGFVTITRNGITRVYNTEFMLVAAMNPCPCGYFSFDNYNTDESQCFCTPAEIRRYHRRISGPIQDRIDIVVRVPQITAEEQLCDPIPNQTLGFRNKIKEAQKMRLSRHQVIPNSQIPGYEATKPRSPYMLWTRDALDEFMELTNVERFSSRKRSRVAKVSRSIADILFSERIEARHVHQAFKYVHSELLS